MCHEDFFDFKKLVVQMGMNNTFKNTEGEPFKTTETKILMVRKGEPGKIFYKNSYEQDEFLTATMMNSRRQKIDYGSLQLDKAYKNKLCVSEGKKKDYFP